MGREDQRLDELQRRQPVQAPNTRSQNHQTPIPQDFEDEEYEEDNDMASVASMGRVRGARNEKRRLDKQEHRGRDGVDRNIDNIKMKIPLGRVILILTLNGRGRRNLYSISITIQKRRK